MKKSNDTIGNRTRDLPAQCLNQLRHSVPQAQEELTLFSWCNVTQLLLREHQVSYLHLSVLEKYSIMTMNFASVTRHMKHLFAMLC